MKAGQADPDFRTYPFTLRSFARRDADILDVTKMQGAQARSSILDSDESRILSNEPIIGCHLGVIFKIRKGNWNSASGRFVEFGTLEEAKLWAENDRHTPSHAFYIEEVPTIVVSGSSRAVVVGSSPSLVPNVFSGCDVSVDQLVSVRHFLDYMDGVCTRNQSNGVRQSLAGVMPLARYPFREHISSSVGTNYPLKWDDTLCHVNDKYIVAMLDVFTRIVRSLSS